MHIDSYISDLLYRYDCVTIPGFGAFLTTRVSAKVHETTNSFYPPKKVLSFNEQVHHNDGLLCSYIADVEKIPYESAVKKLNKHVKAIKAYLVEGETITFENIGDLTLNEEGKMVFDPSYHINYLTDAFGLAQFVSQNVTREAYKQEVEAIEETVPLTITPEKRQARPYLKYAAIALIALGLGGYLGADYYVGQIEAQNQVAQETAHKQLEHKIQEATFVIDNPLPAVTLNAVKKQTGKYHIIAGAFRVEENSDKKVSELKALGYPARKIGQNRYGLHEVVYASYQDRLEALNALREVKNNHNTAAWLLVKTLD
ncbi:sporulation protein [Mangrovimonas yunxiaonensis]|uniref:Sporulation protein n=1 Tax=Mangrovimonas yunxiaonensis TaxID=1197477 RepID=A0A084TKG4_9FLAO|nr:SPOR domain-containing protein [Mangrovimonas yunxiaonensis]KFB01200.1 sporulation protein [Mangrovimonas yunxiaonensis]GGH38093.1 hypothetical protein GCM10011364_06590 [Mangrovimonas yunxiaonensis]